MISLPPRRARASRGGFTVIEILVACSVMAIILVLLSQMMNIVSRASRQGLDRVDNFTKARAMLDVMANDFERMVVRPDLPNFTTGGTYQVDNTAMGGGYYTGGTYNGSAGVSGLFYTRVTGVNNDSSTSADPNDTTDALRAVSLVSYRIESNTGDPNDPIFLVRESLSVAQSGVAADNVAAAPAFSPAATDKPGTPLNLYTAPGVIAFQILIRRQNGDLDEISNYTGYVSGNPVVSVGISLAVIGNQALGEFIAQPSGVSNLQSLSATFQGLTLDGYGSYKERWDAYVTSNAAVLGLPNPKDAASSFKTYERWVTCTPF